MEYQVVKVSPGGSLPLAPNGQCRIGVCYTMFWGPHHLCGGKGWEGVRGVRGGREGVRGEQEGSEREWGERDKCYTRF